MIILFFLIVITVFALDQFTKWIVKTSMYLGQNIPVIGDFFVLTSHRNKGAAFGILQGQQTFFLIVTVIFTLGIIWYLFHTYKLGQKLVPVALSLLLGGALGNFLDRIMYGEVVDFIQFNFRFPLFGYQVDYEFPIFNIADSAIVIGTAIILLDSLLAWRRESKMESDAKDATHDSI